MNMQRNFYHNLTNSNGDSLIELSEKTLAFNTASYDDGDYRIIVEVYDEAGNFDIDSMDVKFVNSPNEVLNEQGMIYSFNLYQNCPNPFNPSTVISYQLPVGGYVTLEVFDVLGNKIATLVDEYKTAGTYEVEFNTSSIKHHPSSGVYFYQMRAGDYVNVKKMLLLK
jgi:hypothetical protein